MDASQHLGHDDPDGSIEVDEGHPHGDSSDENVHLPCEPPRRPLLIFDILLRLPESFFTDHDFLIFSYPLLLQDAPLTATTLFQTPGNKDIFQEALNQPSIESDPPSLQFPSGRFFAPRQSIPVLLPFLFS